jgi:archaellum component FlaC
MVRVIMKSSLEERVARIEGILEQMDKRLNHIESEIGDLKAYFDGEIKGLRGLVEGWRVDFDRKLENLRRELFEEIRDLRGRFYWIIGIQITMWVTIILTILFKHA